MNTPQMVELRDSNVILIKQSENNFIILDGAGITTFSYEGRTMSQTKYTFPLNSLQPNQIALNSKYCIITGLNYVTFSKLEITNSKSKLEIVTRNNF